MSSFQFIHKRRVAELEYEYRLLEIELEEHLATCDLVEKNLMTDVLDAKMRLLKGRIQLYAISNHVSSRFVSSPPPN